MSCPESNAWLEACQDELQSLKETQTYVPVSTDDIGAANIVGCHWVFAIKHGLNGSVKQYKACIVAKGFSQEYQINYDETFAPVVKWDSIQILLALAACFDLEVDQMDVKTAFLNSDLEHSIYMEPPPGSMDYGQPNIVWQLQKSLYGLKQASHAWYQKAKQEFENLGFTQSYADHSVFTYDEDAEVFCIIALYVDDLMVVCNNTTLMRTVKTRLMEMFKVKDLGPIHWFLGLEIICDRP